MLIMQWKARLSRGPEGAPSAHMRCTVVRMLVFDASAII